MREISIEECRAVFGGTELTEPEIVVTGAKKFDASIYLNSSGGYGTGFGFTGYGGGTGILLALTLPEGWNVEAAEGQISGDGLPLVDANGDGYYDNAEIVVFSGPASANPGSWYGGGWLAGLTGASVSGGGDQRFADWLVGLGYGYNIGYSSDSDIAAAYGDNSPDGVIAPNVITINGVPFIFQGIPGVSNIEFNPRTGTYGVGVGVGGAYAIDTIERRSPG